MAVTCLGAIYVGSTTAFNAFVGSFVVFSTLSYVGAILPHLLTRRKYMNPGPFWMKGTPGLVMHALACGYMIVFIVIFCFPYALPTTAASMNYTVLVTGAETIVVSLFWLRKRSRGYQGPKALMDGQWGADAAELSSVPEKIN